MYKRVLLTGGACAGKTQSIEVLKEYCTRALGYHVFVINEIPTMLIYNGITPKAIGKKEFLKLVVKMYFQIQQDYEEVIVFSHTEKNILLMDGSPLDCLKFITQDELDIILSEFGWDFHQLLVSYDGIIFLDTVAKKYPQFYSTSNNKARLSDVEMAIKRNDRLLNSISTHVNLKVIESQKDFEIKKKEVREAIFDLLA